MGIDVFIVNHKNKTLFDMGKCVEFLHDGLPEWKTDPCVLLERLARSYVYNDNFSVASIMRMRDKIWSFIQGATPEQIDVMADEFAYELNYKETDARYCKEEDVKKYAEDIGYDYLRTPCQEFQE